MENNLNPLDQIDEKREEFFGIYMHVLRYITHDREKMKSYSSIFLYL